MNKFLFKHIPKSFSVKTKCKIGDCIIICNMLLFMIPLTILFDNWYFTVIGTIIYNICMKYTYSFHCKNLDNCILLTNLLFIIFGFIAKQSVDYLWVVFLLCLFIIKEIYLKTPLKITNDKKDKKYHKTMFIKWAGLFIFISIICLFFNLKLIVSCILWSFILLYLLLFINE